MSDYEPGTVAVATVRGVPDVRVMRREDHWASVTHPYGVNVHSDDLVTDVRPLVVLDLGAWLPEYVAMFPEWLRSKEADAPSGSLLCYLANEIEAQTRPPRIPEPTGLGAVVEMVNGDKVIRTSNPDFPWVLAHDPSRNAYHWTEYGGLPAEPVRVITEGVRS